MPWVRTIAYCERDRYAQSVLLSRMRSGDIDRAPIWDDVQTLSAKNIESPVDIIFGGFPCQDISTAGRGGGLAGARSGLFFEICRITSDFRPCFVFLENVPAITVRGLDRVLLEFNAMGYDTRWTTISAASLGACHQRDRWFLLAYSGSLHLRKQYEPKFNKQAPRSESVSEQGVITDTEITRFQRIRRKQEITRPCAYGGWISQPGIRGRTHGVQNRVDRVRCLGNSVVPEQARKAFMKLSGLSL